MGKVAKYVRRVLAGEEGGVLIFTALTLPVFLAMFALVVDVGMLRTEANKLQIAADASALAGAAMLPDTPTAEAVFYAERNYPSNGGASVLVASDVESGNWDGTSFTQGVTPLNAVRTTTRRSGDNSITAILAGAVGITEFDLTRVAVAELILGPPCASLEEFATGTVITDQLPGMTVSVEGGAGMAMIFDTDNPTGGDEDLATDGQGKVLIISEDGDSSDPDDNARGGTITYTFDEPVHIQTVKAVDVEEGAEVTAYDEFGNVIATSDVPKLKDGEVAEVTFDIEDVYSLAFEMSGSGAFDDLCFGTRSRDLKLVL